MCRQRFALFGNIYQPEKSALAEKLLRTLTAQGAEILIDRPFHDYLTQRMQLDIPSATLIDGDSFDADFALSMGGDGTFLQTAARIGRKGIPIIGVNTGRMGFLADVGNTEIEHIVQNICDGDYRLESRSVLEVRSSARLSTYPYALNEVAVLKRDNSSMISIRVAVNGEYLTTYQADGLIVNTPTGSTGYALSVGGPIMPPGSRVIGLVPVAPHSLNVRPISLQDDAEVSLTVESRNHQFLVAIDGRSETCAEDVCLKIHKADYTIQVLKRHDSSFFRTLREKLMWGSDVRN